MQVGRRRATAAFSAAGAGTPQRAGDEAEAHEHESVTICHLERGAYPVEQAAAAPLVRLEMPAHGGHVGFLDRRGGSVAERSVATWAKELVGGV